MTWSDNESTSDGESSDELINLALVGLNDEYTVQGDTEEVRVNNDISDSNDNGSEVNSFNRGLYSSSPILDELTMQEHNNVSIGEFLELKATNTKLEEKNAYLRKIVYDLMTKKTSKEP